MEKIIYSYLEKGKDGLGRDIRYIKEENLHKLIESLKTTINYNQCCTELKASKEAKTLELENELQELTEDLEFEMDIPKVHKIGMLILKEKIKLLKSL